MSEIGRTTRIARAIVEVLRPLTGDRSSGIALVTATAGDIMLPARSFLAPLRRSISGQESIDRENLVRTTGEDAIVRATGTLVPIVSVLGGSRQNYVAGTRLRFDPPLDGVEELATIAAPGMTGGATATGVGAVCQIIEYETITGPTAATDLFNARVQGGAPAIVLAWESSGGAKMVARGVHVRPDRWILYVITSRGDGAGKRRDEARDILDAVESYLVDRHSVAGYVFSAPATEILGRSRLAVTKTSYIYAVSLQTTGRARRIDSRPDDELSFAEWKRTRLDAQTADVPPSPVVADVVFPMLLGPFDGDAFGGGVETSGGVGDEAT
jgi:hypothetical protein